MQRSFDTLALLGICGVLLVAFYYQLVLGELPCPLCALQRVGFVVAGVGLMLNLRAGYSPAHYGLVLLTSVAAGSASLRQIALHVVPGSGSYGSAFFGFHFYTWAFVGYGALVVYVGMMLLLAPATPMRDRMPPPAALARLACGLFVVLALANAAAFLLECGLGPCPDDPVNYLWWPKGALTTR
ncbi:MAG: disulfide bond formation protein B [Betaproteobacteria bacterium]